MQFSLRTLLIAMFVIFIGLVLVEVFPAELLYAICEWLVQLAAVVLFLTAINAQGRLRAFAIGGLAGIVVPWISQSDGSRTAMPLVARMNLLDPLFSVGRMVLWLIAKTIWIGACGWLGIYLSERLSQSAIPAPPPIDTQEE